MFDAHICRRSTQPRDEGKQRREEEELKSRFLPYLAASSDCLRLAERLAG